VLHANWWNPERATVHYVDGRVVELHEPYVAGGFNYETEHFCGLVREGRRESPVIPHAMSVGMARLLEEARRELGVRFAGEE
jgi:scyllo-inositol 2-dehydrogenase (NADP+)